MDVARQAAGLYRALAGEPGIVDTVRALRRTLALELLAGADRLEVTQFTLNGQSAGGQLRATRAEQLEIYNEFLDNLARGSTMSTGRTIPTF